MLSRLTAITFMTLASMTGTVAVAPAAAVAQGFGSHFFPESAIHDWSGERYTIVRIDSLPRFSELRERLDNWMDANPDGVEALQQTIRGNGEFATALRARNVQLNNVGAVVQAFNGNLVVYLR
jgi:hypothetical protein